MPQVAAKEFLFNPSWPSGVSNPPITSVSSQSHIRATQILEQIAGMILIMLSYIGLKW